MKITIGNLKGGTAKTTSAVYLATALGAQGRTLLVDADPQGSALDWSTNTADWPTSVTVIPWSTRDLARRVKDVAADYAHIVIDTAPQHDVIMRQALLVTDHLIVPVTPSPMELRRLAATFDLAAEVDAISAVYARVLLCKVRSGTKTAVEAREMLVNDLDLPVFDAQTHLWESYLLSWGTVPDDALEYGKILKELQAVEAEIER
ncbi:ParA family partition ATPase [Kribbella solani]